MVIRKKSQTLEHRFVRELPSILPRASVLVANNTRVFRARLLGNRIPSSGGIHGGGSGKVEFFLLKRLGPLLWQGLIKSSAKVLPGFQFQVKTIEACVTAREDTVAGTLFTVRLSSDPIELNIGEVPLPPYIVAKRGSGPSTDELEIYNTVFAKQTGSVAAPTAGRHFTSELISELKACGMDWEEITLHVGMGTFKPVTVNDIREHQMHPEMSYLGPEIAKRLLLARQKGRPIIAIGTTSARTLEGRGRRDEHGTVQLDPGENEVNLFIHPDSRSECKHDWKWVDGLLTNFHLSESTLLMMVADFLGDLTFLKMVYQCAIEEKYRFYSYGDAMLILPE